LDLVHDLAIGPPRARDASDGLVLARVESSADRLDRRHALALEQRPELAVEEDDALDPAGTLELRGHMVEGSIEVVGDSQELAQKRLAGQAELPLAVLGRAPLEVGKVGSRALQ
jgi:hypothetical protein